MNNFENTDLLTGLVGVVDHLTRDALRVYLTLRCGMGDDRTTYCAVDDVASLFDLNAVARAEDAIVELLGKGLILTVEHDEKSVTLATTFRMPELRPPLVQLCTMAQRPY